MDVFRLEQLSTGSPVITKLRSLKRKAEGFVVANYLNKRVYLSGGEDEAAKKVSYFDLVSLTWHKAPPLNEGREDHGSICLRGHIYVFGGFFNKGSVESL